MQNLHETENASEPDPRMAMMLELSDQEFFFFFGMDLFFFFHLFLLVGG